MKRQQLKRKKKNNKNSKQKETHRDFDRFNEPVGTINYYIMNY